MLKIITSLVHAGFKQLLVIVRYRYPPDMQEKATQTVLAESELMAGEWAI